MTPRHLLGAAGLLAVTATTAVVLRLAATAPREALGQLARTDQAADVSVPLVALASLLAWALLLQLVVVTALTLLCAGPAPAVGEAALRRCAPAGVRRLVAVTLGAGLLVGTGAGAATAGAPVPLDWPAAAAPATAPYATAGPLPAPVDAPAPVAGTDRPAPPAAPTTRAAPADVVVAAGDTLWALSRAALPPGADDRAVARAWPAWWSTNRAVIGDDPDLLHPGQALRAPR